MNRVPSIVQMHLRGKNTWFSLPYMILFFSFIVNLLIGVLIHPEEGIYTGGILSIYIFMLIMGMITMKDTFAFAIGFSVRRTDYFLGTLLLVTLVNGCNAIVLLVFSLIEQSTGFWGVNLHFFHLPYLNDGNVIQQLIIYFSLLMNIYFLGFLISSVHRRFGKFGIILFLGTATLVSSVFSIFSTLNNWWIPVFKWVIQYTAFELALWFLVLTIVYIVASYFFIRKA